MKLYGNSKNAQFIQPYVAVYPTPKTGIWLQKLVSALIPNLPGVEPAAEHHCTLAYCPKDVHWKTIKSLITPNRNYPAKVIGADVFGNLADRSAFLVLLLESEKLNNKHEKLRSIGVERHFDSYKPHVTLAKFDGKKNDRIKFDEVQELYEDAKDKIIAELKDNDVTLYFHNEKLEDIIMPTEASVRLSEHANIVEQASIARIKKFMQSLKVQGYKVRILNEEEKAKFYSATGTPIQTLIETTIIRVRLNNETPMAVNMMDLTKLLRKSAGFALFKGNKYIDFVFDRVNLSTE